MSVNKMNLSYLNDTIYRQHASYLGCGEGLHLRIEFSGDIVRLEYVADSNSKRYLTDVQ